MANRALIRFLFGPIPALILSLALLLALFLLVSTMQHAKISGDVYTTLLAVNVVGIIALCALIAGNLWRLLRQYRARVLGSRLTLRMVGTFVVLVMVPLSVLYYFSLQFLSKGVDGWFDVRVEQAVDDALLLGQTTLEAIKQSAVDEVQAGSVGLAQASDRLEVIQLLDSLRQRGGYSELSLYSEGGRIIASSGRESQPFIPVAPDEAILSQISKGQNYVSLEPLAGGAQQLRVVVPVPSRSMGEPGRALQALKLVPLRYAKLVESVESASTRYKQIVFSRAPLKFSLILSLSLVTLVAMLSAAWAAIYLSRRMAAPLRDLAEGTRAVAEGDYKKELPVTSSDELGVLVKSFNEMTQQINRAQNEAQRSQREVENQRAYLETVLAHLSSGVFSFDRNRRLLTRNTAAGQILGIDLDAAQGRTAGEIKEEHPRFEPFFAPIEDAMQQGIIEWQAEAAIFGTRGRQVLIVRGTQMPGTGGGYVVVFDDVTNLIQAQRDAAWGEVARRLAHEIKNPLTPIQLSAERIRNKYLGKLQAEDRDTLDRATRTIAQQVESMKTMVNEFSSYAQPGSMELAEIDLNHLVQDVAELHKREDRPMQIVFDLADKLPVITADAGRLRQVLNNLLINARDALIDTVDPTVRIATRSYAEPEPGHVELVVEDNGPGVPGELMDRLFEPYVTTKERGTGLGLAIVKRIVEEHGGAIWAENIADQGTRLVLRLPVNAQRTAHITDLNLKLPRVRAAGGKHG